MLFRSRSLLSTFVWAVYSCAIGAVAGAWFEDHHLVAITVALIAAVVMALIIERGITAMHRALDRRAARREAALRTEPTRPGQGSDDEGAAGAHDDRAHTETIAVPAETPPAPSRGEETPA